MGRRKIQVVLIGLLNLIFAACCSQSNNQIMDTDIKMLVVLSDEYNFFGETYLKFYNKKNQLIKEEIIHHAGFYTNEIVGKEMFLLGSNFLYKIKLDDFSYEKLDVPNDDGDIIFNEFYIDHNIITYKKNTSYSEKDDAFAEDFCLYNLSEKKELCNSTTGLIKSLYMNKGYIYVLNELNEHAELLVLDDDFNMISKIEYNEKNASKILGVDDNVYVELDDKIYDLEKNIIYSRNEDISHMFMVAMKNENKLNLLYMGSPSQVCDLHDNCFTYESMLFEQGISDNGGTVFSTNSKLIKKTILEDIILFENGSFKKINTIKYPLGLNIVGIYYSD